MGACSSSCLERDDEDDPFSVRLSELGAFSDVFEQGELLGSGAYSEVFRATKRSDGTQWAVKRFDKAQLEDGELEEIFEEARILGTISHPHVIAVRQLYDEAKFLYLVSDLLEGGELVDRVLEKEFYSEADARLVMETLLGAVSYLHSRGIAHRDLKPQNVLLRSRSDDTSLVLVDFGFSKQLEVARRDSARSAASGRRHVCGGDVTSSSDSVSLTSSGGSLAASGGSTASGGSAQSGRAAEAAGFGPHTRLKRMSTMCGTPKYVAPEVVGGRPYLLSCDVWSLGVIAYVLLCGMPPFNAADDEELFDLIVHEEPAFAEEQWRDVSEAAREFVTLMIEKDPRRRPSSAEMLRHRWIAEESHSRGRKLSSAGAMRAYQAGMRQRTAQRLASVRVAARAVKVRLSSMGSSGRGSLLGATQATKERMARFSLWRNKAEQQRAEDGSSGGGGGGGGGSGAGRGGLGGMARLSEDDDGGAGGEFFPNPIAVPPGGVRQAPRSTAVTESKAAATV